MQMFFQQKEQKYIDVWVSYLLSEWNEGRKASRASMEVQFGWLLVILSIINTTSWKAILQR